jgi:histidyl-tRNA synthetase
MSKQPNVNENIRSIPPDFLEVKGTRDYLPAEQIIREYIAGVLKSNFMKYGYGPVETSILEHYEVAASKYTGGSEILKETYKLQDQGGRNLCLRYELTFKLGKLVALNQNLKMPFKRYEIGKVFRDGPVKAGRLREFTQCDADVVGVKSVAADAELIMMTFDIFRELGLNVSVCVNDRKILFGIFNHCSIPPELHVDTALALDKLVKFGEKSVRDELTQKGISPSAADKLMSILNESSAKEGHRERLEFFGRILTDNGGIDGIMELKELFGFMESFGSTADLEFLPTLARGLSYYTGPMWEVYAREGESKIASSLAAGGRWDGMIDHFVGGNKVFPATGMTFGLDVIYMVLEERKFSGSSAVILHVPQVLIVPLKTLNECLHIADELRKQGLNCDVAFEKSIGKSFEYADKNGIPYVVVVGKRELEAGKVTLHNMTTGKEQTMDVSHAANAIMKSDEVR